MYTHARKWPPGHDANPYHGDCSTTKAIIACKCAVKHYNAKKKRGGGGGGGGGGGSVFRLPQSLLNEY